jgi:hypothetical protein
MGGIPHVRQQRKSQQIEKVRANFEVKSLGPLPRL